MYPDDSIQSLVKDWWLNDETNKVCRGRLIWTIIPHVDLLPMILVPEGRSGPTDHTKCRFTLKPLDIDNPPQTPQLPVAALPNFPDETRIVYRAKRRPAIILSIGGPEIPREIRTGGVRWQTAPTLLVVPCYGIEASGKRGGFREDFVSRIRRCEYPQYMWDKLPTTKSGVESILFFNRIQPIGKHYNSFETTPFKLSEEAMKVVDEWALWILTDCLDENGTLFGIRQGLLEIG